MLCKQLFMESTGNRARIGGVMVLFNPDWDETLQAVDALSAQLDILCLIDNTPDDDAAARFNSRNGIIYKSLGHNAGIAAAQNEGIRILLRNDCSYILFSDQDSMPEPDAVKTLYNAVKLLEDNGVAVGAVGSRAICKTTGEPYHFESIREIGYPQELKNLPDHHNITECYSVISSISMIPAEALRINGGFDEILFIDGVDHEWCWRAWHAHKLRSFIADDVPILHSLGNNQKSIGSRKVSVAATFRTYYQFRNFIWLKKRNYVPDFWIKKNRIKYIVKAIYFPLTTSPRLKYLKNICRGVWDGIRDNHPHSSFPNFKS